MPHPVRLHSTPARSDRTRPPDTGGQLLENLAEMERYSTCITTEAGIGLAIGPQHDTNGDGATPTRFIIQDFMPHHLLVIARRVSRAMAARFGSELNLTVSEVSVLSIVGQQGPISPTTIADQTSMDKVRVSRTTAALVARGLVQQSRDPHDGRARLMRLTRRGTALYGKLAPIADEIERELTAAFGKSDAANLQRVLARLDVALQALERPQLPE